ncbi:MAG: ATP-binding protein, partial [Cyanobacteria bacterium J06576_12]
LKAVASQEFDAVDDAFVQSERVRMAILLGSMVVSAAISILCAILTTKAIVKPLQRTTTVAKQVVEDADFDLQAPVTTGDAVGELTKALNELIRSVKALLLAKEHSKIQLVQAEKMSSLGQMVAGLAHEINNPVNFISTNLAPAKEHAQGLLTLIAAYQSSGVQPQGLPPELDADEIDFMLEDLPKILDSMTMGTHRITDIVKSLKGFSRKDDSTLKPSDLHEGIENTLLILGHQLKADGDFQGVEVIKDYGDLPLVDCFPGQINQVIMNILANAIDALKSAADTIEQPTIWIQTDVLGSGWVQLRLRDNGTGIESTVLSKLFEPFFTTKPEGKGTGLGLSISHQIIVEKHGGKLVCDSVLGEGTEFVIEIPLNLSL